MGQAALAGYALRQASAAAARGDYGAALEWLSSTAMSQPEGKNLEAEVRYRFGAVLAARDADLRRCGCHDAAPLPV